jgi:PII-like signaling protein
MPPGMHKRDVVLVRVYLTERRAKLKALLHRLAASGKARGITVFEASAGFGTTAMLSDEMTSVEGKPVVLEFFDEVARAHELVDLIRTLVAPRHVVFVPATVQESSDAPVMLAPH